MGSCKTEIVFQFQCLVLHKYVAAFKFSTHPLSFRFSSPSMQTPHESTIPNIFMSQTFWWQIGCQYSQMENIYVRYENSHFTSSSIRITCVSVDDHALNFAGPIVVCLLLPFAPADLSLSFSTAHRWAKWNHNYVIKIYT